MYGLHLLLANCIKSPYAHKYSVYNTQKKEYLFHLVQKYSHETQILTWSRLYTTQKENFGIFKFLAELFLQLCSLNRGNFFQWNLTISCKIWETWVNGAFWLGEMGGHITLQRDLAKKEMTLPSP